MPLHPAEEATLRTFVVPSKRDRLLTLFGSSKRRSEARNLLNHFEDWDARVLRERRQPNLVIRDVDENELFFWYSGKERTHLQARLERA